MRRRISRRVYTVTKGHQALEEESIKSSNPYQSFGLHILNTTPIISLHDVQLSVDLNLEAGVKCVEVVVTDPWSFNK